MLEDLHMRQLVKQLHQEADIAVSRITLVMRLETQILQESVHEAFASVLASAPSTFHR